jgi:hypothetical protein
MARAAIVGLAAVAAIVLLAAAPARALAADFTWNGGFGYWGDATKWTPNGVPDADHTAEISAPGTYTVSGSGTMVAKTLVLGGASGRQTLAIVASSTPDGGPGLWANATLYVGGGSIVGTNGVMLFSGVAEGPSHWSSLNVAQSQNPGMLINRGTMRFAPGGGGIRQLTGDVENSGTIDVEASTWHANAGRLLNRGVLHILPGCTFDSSGNVLGFENAAGGSVVNEGLLHFNGGLGFTQGQGTTSGNPVLIEGCMLNLTGEGGASFQAVGTLEVTGTLWPLQSITVRAGNGYWANASLTVHAPFLAYGRIRLTSGGGGIDTLSVSSPHAGDALTIMDGGSLTVDDVGGGTRGLTGNITNEGTVTVDADTSYSGSGRFGNRGAFAVTGPHTFDAEGNSIGFANGDGGSIDNMGKFYFSGGQGFEQGAGTTSGIPLIVGSVPLQFTGGGASHFVCVFNTQVSGAMVPGQSLITMSGTAYSTNAHTSMSSPFTSGGMIVLASGGAGGGGQCQFGDSTFFTNDGTVTVNYADGGSRQLSCAPHNDGIIQVSSVDTQTGILDSMGLSMDSEGILAVRIGGTTVETGYDQFRSSAGVSLAGTLRASLVRGFSPSLGDAFRVVTAPGFADTTFDHLDLPALTAGRGWSVSYPSSSPAVVLTVVPDSVTAKITSVHPTSALTLTNISFSGSATDTAGHAIVGYQWRSSINGVFSTSKSFSWKLLSAGTHTIYFRARCEGGSWSPEVHTHVTLKRRTTVVGTPSTARTVTHGKAFTASGSLSPSHPATAKGVLLYCYRYESRKWKLKLKVWASASGSKYTARVTLPSKGSWRIKGYHALDAYSYSDWSGNRSLTAK